MRPPSHSSVNVGVTLSCRATAVLRGQLQFSSLQNPKLGKQLSVPLADTIVIRAKQRRAVACSAPGEQHCILPGMTVRCCAPVMAPWHRTCSGDSSTKTGMARRWRSSWSGRWCARLSCCSAHRQPCSLRCFAAKGQASEEGCAHCVDHSSRSAVAIQSGASDQRGGHRE